jgi:hypothetical protein
MHLLFTGANTYPMLMQVQSSRRTLVKTGILSVVKEDEKYQVVVAKDAGTVDYEKGEIIINTVNITSTVADNDIIEIQAFPDSNDVVGLKDLYLSFNVSNSTINMVKDVIASGEDISGVSLQEITILQVIQTEH